MLAFHWRAVLRVVPVATPQPTMNPAEAASWLLVSAMVLYMAVRGAEVLPFLTMTDKTPWVWEVTSMGYFLKIAMDSKEQVKDMYFAQAMVQTAINAFGGGFLAPLIVAHCPVPLMEETFLWMVVAAWYIVHHMPTISKPLVYFNSTAPGRALFIVLFAIFKTNQIVGGIELADNAVRAEELVQSSRYFKYTPFAAPLICGFLSGCGGGFLPLEKGLAPLEKGGAWPVRSSFFASVAYYVLTRKAGCEKLTMKAVCMIFRALGDHFPAARDKIVTPATRALYVALQAKRDIPAK